LSLPFLICTSQDTIEQVKDLQAAEHRYVAWIPRPLDVQKVPGWLGQLVARLKRQAEVASYLGELSLFLTRKHFDHALSLLGHAVKALPDSSALYEALGDLYAEPEMPCEEAERKTKRASAYELAWRTNRYDERVLAKAVEALEALGKHDEVLRVIKQYLQRFGFDDQWRTRLAKVFFQLGDYGAASVELKRVLNLNPSNSEAQAMLQVIASLHAPPAAGKQAA
jgi:tetratricopeptide (TPR) repeat protein